MRMVCDTPFILDPECRVCPKLTELESILEEVLLPAANKVLVFSEWERMLLLVRGLAEELGEGFAWHTGTVPQKRRRDEINRFKNDPDCRLFLSTDAGSVGLNLQAANTVINVDLPWNPAVLEQRIARAYRMGQKQPVQVFILVTESTIEENLLATLSAKHDLALAALDVESDVDQVDLQCGMEELRRRLEVLLGARPEAPLDESVRRDRESEAARSVELERAAGAELPAAADREDTTERQARREKLAATGGQLLTAAFQFLGELLPPQPSSAGATEAVSALATSLKQSLTNLVEHDEQGRPRLTVALPDSASLDNLTNVLARLLAQGQRS
jgi:superfamily II DNA/RNA helicase